MAVRADGSTDRLSRTTSLPTASSFTMMGWFKISVDRNAYSTFLSYGTGSTKKVLQTDASGTALVTWDGMFEVATGQSLTVGTWAHVAMTFNGSNITPYVNAVAGGLGGSGSGNPSTQIEFFQSESDEWLNGCAAALKVYSAVLTAGEIAQEMRQYLPVRTANLNSFYPLLSVVDDQVDFSGAGLTLTVGGTLATEDGPPIPWAAGRQKFVYVEASGGGDDIEGSASVTLGALAGSATGTLDLSGQASVTLGAATSTATGTVALSAAASTTFGALSSVATGTLALSGSLSATLGAATVTGAGGQDVTGQLDATLGAATVSATGTVALSAAATPTLGALTASATGTVALSASASVTLGSVTPSATGAVALSGTLSATLGAASVAGEGVLGDAPIEGALAKTLGALTGAATGTLEVRGSATVTLGPAAASATATLSLSASLASTLGGVTVTATSALGLNGSATRTLGTLTVVATGVLGDFEEDLPARIAVRGSYVPSVEMTGTYVPTIPLIGSKG